MSDGHTDAMRGDFGLGRRRRRVLVNPANWSIAQCLEWLRAKVAEAHFTHTKGWRVADWREAVCKEQAALIAEEQ